MKLTLTIALALGLSLAAKAAPVATDYTPVSINLSASYLVSTAGHRNLQGNWVGGGDKGAATSINNASLLARIGSYLNTNLAGAKLAIDNSSGHVCVIKGTNTLVFDLSVLATFTDTNGIEYEVYVDRLNLRNDFATVLTGGTSATNGTYSVSGTTASQGAFHIYFYDTSYGYRVEYNIYGRVGTFTSSLSGTNTYKQSLSLNVFGSGYDDNLPNEDSNLSFTGTVTAAGGPNSTVTAPSVWDVITPSGP